MAELFGLTGTPDPVNDRVPFLDASETLANQLKDCSPRTLVNSGLELQANGDSTSAIVRHTSLGYITGHIPIASPDTLANSLPAGSITGTPVITPGASLLVQFVIASAIGANGYNVYKRRCGKSGATNWRGVEGWELEVSVETAGTVNLDLELGSWEIAVQTVSDLQKGAITYVFRTDSGTVVGGAIDSATITQNTSGVRITPVISGTFANIHVFHRRQKEDGSFGPLQEELFASSDTVLVIPSMDTGNTWFYLIAEDGEYYNTAYVSLGYYVETPGVAGIMENGGGGGSVDVSGKMNKSANLSDVVDTVDALNNIGGLPKLGGTLTGPVFAAHAISVSETAIGDGTALTVGKAHTVTLSANRTITFSGTTVDGDTIQLVATVSTACTLTFPASYRNGELASTVTTLDLPLGKHCLIWKRTAGTWLLFDPIPSPRIEHIQVACSDETTALTTGTKLAFRMPRAFKLTSIRASVGTAPTGSTLIVDVNSNGTTLMAATKLSIDATEKTSATAATAAVLSTTDLADDAEITVDIDQIGSTIAGAGLKVTLIGYAV